nr:hypothetical protein JVH1_1148 [Rhodococcus sp. JVH1]
MFLAIVFGPIGRDDEISPVETVNSFDSIQTPTQKGDIPFLWVSGFRFGLRYRQLSAPLERHSERMSGQTKFGRGRSVVGSAVTLDCVDLHRIHAVKATCRRFSARSHTGSVPSHTGLTSRDVVWVVSDRCTGCAR